jgi:hypothetical protein
MKRSSLKFRDKHEDLSKFTRTTYGCKEGAAVFKNHFKSRLGLN